MMTKGFKAKSDNLHDKLVQLAEQECMIDLTTQEGRDKYAVVMSEMATVLTLMPKLLLTETKNRRHVLKSYPSVATRRGYGRASGGFRTR